MPSPLRVALGVAPTLLASIALASCHSSTPRPLDAERSVERDACTYQRGDLPAATLGREVPLGRDIPIDHFILLMMENRSFDHYFGQMPGVDGHPANASNPDAVGTPVPAFHETAYCIEDVAHSWTASHAEYHDGANDGFVVANDPGGARAMGYYDATDLPFYYDLYGTFAMSDRHHCSALSSTWTNRWYWTAASSFGMTYNAFLPAGWLDTEYAGEPYNIFTLLDQGEIPWRVYYSDLAWVYGGYLDYMSNYATDPDGPLRRLDRFYTDLDAGELPPVTYLDPSFFQGVEQTDEHPPSDPQYGQAFVAQVVDAVMHSPIWERTALIITYDEHGGYYDHVPPPGACVPDDHAPMDSDGTPRTEAYDRLGFRVPLVVVSPFARRHYVSHHTTDHTSVLRLIEARFELAALTRRDANAWPLADMFDFEHPDYSIPTLATPTIDAAKSADCHAAFP